MFALRGKQDAFRLLLPDDFIVDEINEKYSKILADKHSFYQKPIDFINETIQSIQVLGFNEASLPQQQTSRGDYAPTIDRKPMDYFMHTSSDVNYRSEVSPIQLIDKTFNVNFRHTLGFLNYFILFENFFYLYSRDTDYDEISKQFNVDILNSNGSIYSKIVLYNPIINGMDMLDLNYSQPIAQSQTFKIEFKYSNLDFQFIDIDNKLSLDEAKISPLIY